jgi:cation transport ATPase
VSSFNCAGCDCGACLSDAIRAVEGIDGVLHVRVDRTRTQLVVRYDPTTADAGEFLDQIRGAKLDPL